MDIKLFVPKSYDELTDRQARWLFRALVNNPDMNSVEFKLFAFIRFSGIRVITRYHDTGEFRIESGKTIFRIDPEQIAVATRHLDWILFPPKYPWRTHRLAGRKTRDARLYDLPFGDWLAIDNLYQGYLRTEDPALLVNIADILLPRLRLPLRRWELQVILRWIVSVKEFYTRRFRHFFSGGGDQNSLGTSAPTSLQLEQAMNAQIRALTKGDIAKEQEILAMPTLRALVELDAQAKEYQDLKAKTKK